MTMNRRRMLALALALSLFFSLWPSAVPQSAALAESLGIVTSSSVHVRKQSSTSAEIWFDLSQNTICTILAETDAEGIHWYKVETTHPENRTTAAGNTYIGFIHGDFFRPLTAEEATSYSQGSEIFVTGSGASAAVVTNAAPATVSGTIGVVTHGGTNFREGPSMKSRSMMKLDRGTQVEILTAPSVISSETFYEVRYSGLTGYIMSTFIRVDSSPVITSVPTATPTPDPGATATPTPDSSVTATPTPPPAPTATSSVNVLGYVRTTKGGCNLRASIGGTVIKQIKRNTTLPYLLPPVTKNGYTWYYVDADGNRGYLRSDVVKVVNVETPTPTAAPTPSDGSVTPAPTVTDGATGYVKTTAGGVNLRERAGYTDVLGQVDRDVVMPYYGTPTTVKGVIWYYVSHPTLGAGYLHGSYLALVNSDGTLLPTPTPISVNTPTSGGSSSDSKQEASYTTLKLGSTGASVKNLIQELKNQGYYNGSVTTRYTSSVERAVEAFQRAKGLTVDGVAGSATQHALYGTVPVGTADTTNLTMTIYPAEKIDWYTGGINELWPRGSNYKVFDVYTGVVWWAHRWAGSKHVDAEPLTAADTARLCKIYGVSTAEEIASKDLYQRRPMLVTIGTRTFACSLYGEPHNEEGNTIKDNNFPGQLCIHFTNSRIHGSNKVDSGHQEAIEYAWENAPNGHI